MCRATVVMSVLALFVGCAGEDAAKTSHFEHDHEVAPHWPSDLADAAAKIRERLAVNETKHLDPQQAADEIADIVGWVPEIAADTDLSEQDWIPLDQAAESLSANLRATKNALNDANRTQAIALCELLERSFDKILVPVQLSEGESL
jgi:hypothetical protein